MTRYDTNYGDRYRSGNGGRAGPDGRHPSSPYSHSDGSAYAQSAYGDRYRDYQPHYPYGREDSDFRGGDDAGRPAGDWRQGRDWERNEYGSYRAPYDGREWNRDDDGRRARGDDRDRNWWDRTKDEVSSWFGDDDDSSRRKSHRGRGPKGYTRSDDRIREDVSDRLTDDHVVDASDIEVTVKDGEVTLSGTVDCRRAKRRAEDCAEDVSGVKHVQNNLRFKEEREQGSAKGGRGRLEAEAAESRTPATQNS